MRHSASMIHAATDDKVGILTALEFQLLDTVNVMRNLFYNVTTNINTSLDDE